MKDGDRELLLEEEACGCGWCVYRYGAYALGNCRAAAIRVAIYKQIVHDLEGEIETLEGLKTAAKEDAPHCSRSGMGGAFLLAGSIGGAIDVLVENLTNMKERFGAL